MVGKETHAAKAAKLADGEVKDADAKAGRVAPKLGCRNLIDSDISAQANWQPRILAGDTRDTGDAMPILRLIAKIRNVLPFRTAKATNPRKFTFVELQALADGDDFGEILLPPAFLMRLH